MAQPKKNANNEGTIYLRKDGRWEGSAYVLTTDGTYKRRSVYGKTWDDADKVSAEELKKSGNTVANLDAATAAEVKKRIADIESDWIARAKKEGLQDPAAALKALRDEIAKLKQGS